MVEENKQRQADQKQSRQSDQSLKNLEKILDKEIGIDIEDLIGDIFEFEVYELRLKNMKTDEIKKAYSLTSEIMSEIVVYENSGNSGTGEFKNYKNYKLNKSQQEQFKNGSLRFIKLGNEIYKLISSNIKYLSYAEFKKILKT